jgi:excisionase family DNA binding protein
MRPSLEAVLVEARTLPAEDLPEFLGELEHVRVVALARIAAPVVQARPDDELLDVAQTARRMNCSRDYLYRNHKRLPFTRPDRVGRKLLFSSAGLDSYLKRAR